MCIRDSHIASDLGFVFIDLKPDESLLKSILAQAVKEGRLDDVIIFSPGDSYSCAYNLCRHGNATEIRDKVVGALEWSDSFYQKVSEEVLLKLCVAFVHLRDTHNYSFTLKDIYHALSSPEAIQSLIAVSYTHLTLPTNREV